MGQAALVQSQDFTDPSVLFTAAERDQRSRPRTWKSHLARRCRFGGPVSSARYALTRCPSAPERVPEFDRNGCPSSAGKRNIEDKEAMFERMMPILKSVCAGAATQVYVATHPSLAEVSGEYFSDCPVAELLVPLTQAEIDALWKKTEEIVAAW